MIELAPLMHAEVALAPIRDLGDTPFGRRRIIGITGGKFSGARRPAAVVLDFFEVK